LDGDDKGTEERARYNKEYGLPISRTALLPELVSGCSEIEDLLDDDAKSIVSGALGLTKAPSKNQIRRFFQERLASGDVIPLGARFEKNAGELITSMKKRLGAPS
jgi:hypothetical protein